MKPRIANVLQLVGGGFFAAGAFAVGVTLGLVVLGAVFTVAGIVVERS